jgi:hypothetical protein
VAVRNFVLSHHAITLDCRPTGNYPETGLGEINRDLLEEDFWPAQTPCSWREPLCKDQLLMPIDLMISQCLESMTSMLQDSLA